MLTGQAFELKCKVTLREFYPVEEVEEGKTVIRCSECRMVMGEVGEEGEVLRTQSRRPSPR